MCALEAACASSQSLRGRFANGCPPHRPHISFDFSESMWAGFQKGFAHRFVELECRVRAEDLFVVVVSSVQIE